jgi:predicted NAD/FAD-dependent oxidoreductase
MSQPTRPLPPRVAVVGAGLAGASCAAGLLRRGCRVTVFDKSRGVGGRMASRRTVLADGAVLGFDHGAPHVAPRAPRFRALWADAVATGDAAVWRPRVFADVPGIFDGALYIGASGMSALARRLLDGADLRLSQAVQALQRDDDGWWVHTDGTGPVGPFDRIVLAMPPRQAAALLAEPMPDWAEALGAVRMEACWTLMAASDEVDWPWDAAEPARGPLAWVMRNDRRPGRPAPDGWATWVAHATASWSTAHLEEDPADVAQALRVALQGLLPPMRQGVPALRWHHAAAHRWRYALPAAPTSAASEATACTRAGTAGGGVAETSWWDAHEGIGVCGDFLGGGAAEGAWRSGDALAERLAAAPAARQPSRSPRSGRAVPA